MDHNVLDPTERGPCVLLRQRTDRRVDDVRRFFLVQCHLALVVRHKVRDAVCRLLIHLRYSLLEVTDEIP